jgi:hypothetical protein
MEAKLITLEKTVGPAYRQAGIYRTNRMEVGLTD